MCHQAHTGVQSENECLACDRKALGNGEVTVHTCVSFTLYSIFNSKGVPNVTVVTHDEVKLILNVVVCRFQIILVWYF